MEYQDCQPSLWFTETFSNPLQPLNGIPQNLAGSKIATPSTKFLFFWDDWKTTMAAMPLICWEFFDFLSGTAEWNSTNFDRRQVLNVRHQICVFLAARYQHTCMFLSKKRYSGIRLWTCEPLVLLKCVNRSDLWPCQFSICYIQKISRHWIIRAPLSKMREPYSNHFVCPSVCPSVRPSVHTSL